MCNLEEGKKRTRRFEIPVFFHNIKGYDNHLIVSEVGKYTAKLSAIPMNFEKLISFSFSHLKFLDSLGFLSASLGTLVENLYEEVRTTEEGQPFTKDKFENEYKDEDWKNKWRSIENTAIGRGKHKFIHSMRHCSKPEHTDLLLKKGVHPYTHAMASTTLMILTHMELSKRERYEVDNDREGLKLSHAKMADAASG